MDGNKLHKPQTTKSISKWTDVKPASTTPSSQKWV